MGEVYRTLDRLTGDVVALKRVTAVVDQLDATVDLDKTPTGGQQSRRTGEGAKNALALAREFQTLASLRHPNIISVLAYGFDEDRCPYYTMELVEDVQMLLEAAAGRSLHDRVELLVQVLRALSYLHRRGILHRDLKPANVLVEEQAKVVDFGVAIRRGQHERGTVVGTLTHLAPELLVGSPPSEASDLYAVGVMAYQMFAGAYPFDRTTSKLLMKSIVTSEPDFGALEGGEELAQVVRRLMHKEASRRWDRAEEVIEALAAAAGSRLPRETRATRESFLQAAEFVDRVEERSALIGGLGETVKGCGGLWLVEGTSGLGKSRLIDELRTMALVRGVSVVKGQAQKEGKEAYDLWLRPLRRLVLSTPLRDGEAGALKLLIPDLETLLERPVPDVDLDPQAAKEKLLAVIEAVFQRQNRPLVVLLEDLHWAGESLDVLARLSSSLAQLPVMIVGTYRGEEAPRLAWSLPKARMIHLRPLATGDISELTRSMLGGGATREVVDFLGRHTDGNVFFIVETVRALAEEAGELHRVGETPLPERIVAQGIEDVVQQRLDRVPGDHLPVLEWAAVLGWELDWRLLTEVLDPQAVERGLAACSDLALLEVRDNQWRFTHFKFREAVLEAMDEERQRRLHGRIAEVMERIYGGTEERAASLAFHYGRAADVAKEAEFCALAGQAALKRGGYRDAAAQLKRAAELVAGGAGLASDETADLAELAERELDLQIALGVALMATEGPASPALAQAYTRALELSSAPGGASRMTPVRFGLWLTRLARLELEEAEGLARECVALGEELERPALRLRGHIDLANTCFWSGRFDETLASLEQADRLCTPEHRSNYILEYGLKPRVQILMFEILALGPQGRFDLATSRERELLELAGDEPLSRVQALLAATYHGFHLRRVAAVRRRAAEAVELAAETSLHLWLGTAMFFSGWAKVKSGWVAEGLDEIRRGFHDYGEPAGGLLTHPTYSLLLAEAQLAAGDADAGLEAVEEGLTIAEGHGAWCYAAELHRRKGDLLLAAGRGIDAAATCYQRAQRQAAEQGALTFELRSAFSLARLDPGPGPAREALAVIVERFSEGRGSIDLREARAVLG